MTERRKHHARATTPGASARDRADDQPAQPIQPSAADVSRRAYELYEQRGGEHGRDWEDWLQAEYELHNRNGTSRESDPGRAV